MVGEIDIRDSGIEEEVVNEELTEPFNPDEISIDPKAVPMETCLRRLKQKSINLNPDFQRNEVWTEDKKSQLIESLMLKIPLPMFYVSADEKGNWTQKLKKMETPFFLKSFTSLQIDSDRKPQIKYMQVTILLWVKREKMYLK